MEVRYPPGEKQQLNKIHEAQTDRGRTSTFPVDG